MIYPKCLNETETIERAIAGVNLARFGDGEFNLTIGRNCISQKGDKALAAELRAILEKASTGCLPCLPNPYGGSPKKANWQRYENYAITLGKQQFGSAFVTRPDSAPWIDTAEYWSRIRALWAGKDISLVLGTKRSLHSAMLQDAKSVREIWGPRRDAYAEIDRLMEQVGIPGQTVLICLGPTATVMANRLARRDVHAVDLGHLGMMMRHQGAYRFKPDDLLSPQYRALLQKAHAEMDWGGSGHKQADAVVAFANEIGAEAILDYGSGQGYLAKACAAMTPPRRVTQYDPGVVGNTGLPKPSHLVVCSDVLEHVEPDKLDSVLEHLRCLSAMGTYLVIATRPANKNLPDGKNAHLIVKDASWWIEKVGTAGWAHARPPAIKEGHSVTMWLLKQQ